jgi:hypothetical protein
VPREYPLGFFAIEYFIFAKGNCGAGLPQVFSENKDRTFGTILLYKIYEKLHKVLINVRHT